MEKEETAGMLDGDERKTKMRRHGGKISDLFIPKLEARDCRSSERENSSSKFHLLLLILKQRESE